jgi:hypothetical protein
VAGLIGICPEQNTIPPAFIAWLYGPNAFGASAVATISIFEPPWFAEYYIIF